MQTSICTICKEPFFPPISTTSYAKFLDPTACPKCNQKAVENSKDTMVQTSNWRERFDELWNEHDDNLYKEEFIDFIYQVQKESIEQAMQIVADTVMDETDKDDVLKALKTLLH